MRCWSRPRSVVGLLAVVVVALVGGIGCGGIEPVDPYEPITDPAQLYLRLRIDHRAVNLATVAPYDTLQLTATPLNAAGEPLTGLPAPTFRSSDTTRVWVTPEGLLQARRAGSGVRIIAELAVEGNMRQADTIYVNVRATAPPPGPVTLSIDPVPPDSAVWALAPSGYGYGAGVLALVGILTQPQVRPQLLDGLGAPITGLQVEYESLDPSVASVNRTNGEGRPMRPGQVAIVARTTVYGATLADTTVITVTRPVINAFDIQGDSGKAPRLSSTEVVVRRGGYVMWTNLSSDSVDVTFDDPTNVTAIPELCAAFQGDFCLAGNMSIPPVSAISFIDCIRGRRFPVPGVYPFHNTRTGTSGRVVVLDE